MLGKLEAEDQQNMPSSLTSLIKKYEGLQDTPRELYCRGRIPREWPCQWVGGGVRVRLVMFSNLNFRCQLFRVVWKYTAASRDLVGKWVGERELLIPTLLGLGNLNHQGHLSDNHTCLFPPSKGDHVLCSPAISPLRIYLRKSLL